MVGYSARAHAYVYAQIWVVPLISLLHGYIATSAYAEQHAFYQ